MSSLDVRSHPDLLVGLETPDDAGVYQISEDIALIQTLDFLTPVTDDPFEFGQIAAANSLSDIYAMGGTPLTVMNIVCFPSCDLPESALTQTLKGGVEKINEACATLVGGHSVDDDEFKYGLSVTGLIHPGKILTNAGAQIGDAIVLTKSIGTGVLSTAVKAKLVSDPEILEGVRVMAQLNKGAAEVMGAFEVHACTDVTGFGLAGHLLEMAKGSEKCITLDTQKVKLIGRVYEFASMGLLPAGAHKNRKFFESAVEIEPSVNRSLSDLMFDPQTSGGLLISMKKEDAPNCVETLNYQGISASIVAEVTGDSNAGQLRII